jgi:hypothetical protein
MITASQLVHPDLSLSVRRIHLLAACTAFQEKPTLTTSPYTISSAVRVDHFRPFVNAINGAPPDITDGSIADLSSLAAEFGFLQLLHKIELHGPRFPVARSATWDREDVRKLIVTVPDSNHPGRNEVPMLNLTRSLEQLAAHQIAEVYPTPDSTRGDRPPIGSAWRRKTGTKIEGETIETLGDLNSKFQAKIDVLITERHISVKENDKLRIVCQTVVNEIANMKSDNQVLPEERKHLISMNAKLAADQRTCQNLCVLDSRMRTDCRARSTAWLPKMNDFTQ